jgi:hypothetical protein
MPLNEKKHWQISRKPEKEKPFVKRVGTECIERLIGGQSSVFLEKYKFV